MADADHSRSPAVRELLREHFGADIEDIRPLAGGAFSRTLAFSAAGRDYVIRLNTSVHARESFAKDDYAWRHFAAPALPIPRIVATGTTADGWYAISERAAGRTLNEFSRPAQRAVLPALLDTLDAVSRSDTRASDGYGDWDSDGQGRFASWHAYLASIVDNHMDGYYQNWHHLFDDSFLERDLYEAVTHQMLQLAPACPEERALVHNDFHFENIVADGQQVTAVVDWANALYGDPLYDVAWLTWQAAHPGWWYDDGAEILRARYGASPHYATRIACYQCHIGLDHLRYYARNEMRDRYDFCRAWLLALHADAPSR
jgi:hygromycin-B 4-O-kinase